MVAPSAQPSAWMSGLHTASLGDIILWRLKATVEELVYGPVRKYVQCFVV